MSSYLGRRYFLNLGFILQKNSNILIESALSYLLSSESNLAEETLRLTYELSFFTPTIVSFVFNGQNIDNNAVCRYWLVLGYQRRAYKRNYFLNSS